MKNCIIIITLACVSDDQHSIMCVLISLLEKNMALIQDFARLQEQVKVVEEELKESFPSIHQMERFHPLEEETQQQAGNDESIQCSV